ncbi:hypothetical protein SLEP1_g14227 [Rubroshorea leprosula]|uniref:L-ascorbate oxidase n=1 Tax=Rubroshorea leprosula TaxID=152421 RepID=A0AAV5IIB1_9ROSI|nr:hypothetical protein SLEP1_g14227 [Rubroshorea leprosula]
MAKVQVLQSEHNRVTPLLWRLQTICLQRVFQSTGMESDRGTPWFDGTVGLTQCPILPGSTFKYEFVLDRAGTYLYHSHYGMQRVAGLYGSILVSLPDGKLEPFTYDYDQSIHLNDWYNKSTYEQAVGLSSIPFGWVGEPQSLLVNGKGRFNCSQFTAPSVDVGICNTTNPECSPYSLTLVPGKTYRLRISSLTALSSLSFQIEGHNMTVVEADGSYVEPFVVQNLFIYSGETYSVLVKADQDPSRNYWITANVVARSPATPPILAILNYYPNSPTKSPQTVPPSGPAWDDVARRKAQSKAIRARHGYVLGSGTERSCSGAQGYDFDLDMDSFYMEPVDSFYMEPVDSFYMQPVDPYDNLPLLQELKYYLQQMKDVTMILLLSLSLQVFLVLVAPLRKSTGKKCLLLIIWSAYMLAQWIATFGVAFIIQNLDDELEYVSSAALSCWASFLLLHLSYTNNITAFALETKEWLSHMYRLIFQFVATLFVLVLLFPSPSRSSFSSIPAILVFIAAVIKNAERTSALYLASQDRFKKPKEENQHHTTAEIAMKIGGVLDDLEVIQYAYYSYKICRGLVFDQIYNFREQTQIPELFSSIEAENALRLIEVEVNYFSEILRTKSEFVHSVIGYVCRFLAFGLIATALVRFQSELEPSDSSKPNLHIITTNSLFIWAIFQEVMTFIMAVLSDWTFAALIPDARLREKNSCISKVKRLVYSILCYFLVLKRPSWYPCECEVKHEHEVLATPILLRRWSGSISTYNLIGYCLKCCPTRIHYHKRDCLSILINKIIHLSGFVINVLSPEAAADLIKKASKYLGKHKAFSWPGVIFARGICLDKPPEASQKPHFAFSCLPLPPTSFSFSFLHQG